MLSQKPKEKQKQKLLRKASQNSLPVKAILEINKPSTSSHTDTQSPDLQNDLQISPEVIQPEKTSNYDHPDTVPDGDNREYIKNQE